MTQVELSPDIIEKMTAVQMATAGVVFDRVWQFQDGRRYQIVMCATKQLREVQKDYANKPVPSEATHGRILATYLEVDGLCAAHATTKDPDINIDSLLGLVELRERYDREGFSMLAIQVVPAGAKLKE